MVSSRDSSQLKSIAIVLIVGNNPQWIIFNLCILKNLLKLLELLTYEHFFFLPFFVCFLVDQCKFNTPVQLCKNFQRGNYSDAWGVGGVD